MLPIEIASATSAETPLVTLLTNAPSVIAGQYLGPSSEQRRERNARRRPHRRDHAVRDRERQAELGGADVRRRDADEDEQLPAADADRSDGSNA